MLFQLKGKSNFLGRLQEELAQSTNIPQGLQVTYNLSLVFRIKNDILGTFGNIDVESCHFRHNICKVNPHNTIRFEYNFNYPLRHCTVPSFN